MSTPPPAPDGLPLIGQTLAFLRAPLSCLERWGQTDDGVVRARIAGQRVCLVTTPEAVQQILVRESERYQKAEIVRDRLGTLQGGSLVLLEGSEWQTRRQTLQSSMAQKRVAAAGSVTTQYATEMVASWPTDGTVQVDEQARELSLSILSTALFGLDTRGERTPIDEAAEDILARLDLGSVSTYLPEWVPTPTNRRYRRAVSTLHDQLDAVVDRRREDALSGGDGLSRGDGSSSDERSSGTDLLSTMVAAGLAPEEIRDELIAFLFAGYDSTATALACTLGLLGDHPKIQANLRTELAAGLGGQQPTPSDLSELPLLDATVRESLRLYPPQYLLFREPTSEVSVQGYQIDRGTTVVLSPWVLQRDPQFWDGPASFRPQRWLGDSRSSVTDRPEYAYFPYGGGPRHCLGRRLAEQTLRLVVAVVCQRRQFELRGSLSVSAGPTLSLPDGVELQVDACSRSTH